MNKIETVKLNNTFGCNIPFKDMDMIKTGCAYCLLR